jgi:hypothetical protein
MPTNFPVAKGGVTLHGILVEIDTASGKAISIRRVAEAYAPEPVTPADERRPIREEESMASQVQGLGIGVLPDS